MITENLSTLKINKLTKAQFNKALAEGKINDNELYLTPEEGIPTATPSAAGLMSAEDKENLDLITASFDNKVDESDLATVATSGSYNDLTDKPTIPAAITVDAFLSETSTNPLQNKALAAQFKMMPSFAFSASQAINRASKNAVYDAAGYLTYTDDKYATEDYVDDEIAKLGQAMRLLGVSDTAISDGSTTSNITVGGNPVILKNGDVVLYNGYEYVWIGTAWEQLGQEGSFSIKGHTHGTTTANAAPHSHTHKVTVSGTTGANSGSAVTVATGSLSSSGTGATVATGHSGTATVLTGVKASSTDKFLKSINAGSGSLTSTTTQATGDLTYVESISSTAASSSGTAKAGSETHTHSYTKPTGVSLGSNTTSANGIQYIQDVSHTAASLTGTKTFNTDAIKSVALSASSTSTDGPQYVQSISGGSGSLTSGDTGDIQYISDVTHTAASLTGDTTFVKTQGTFKAGTTPVSSAAPSHTSTTSGTNSGTAVTAVTGYASFSGGSLTGTKTFNTDAIKSIGGTKNYGFSASTSNVMTAPTVSGGVLSWTVVNAATQDAHTGTAASTGTVGFTAASLGTASTASVAPSGHTHSYDKTTGITLTRGTAPSLGTATTGTVGISGGSISKTTKYLTHAHTAASGTTKYMKATPTAASTGTVGISGGSISKTTRYFHPSITTESANTGAPSATTTFVTGITGGTTSATTKYLHHVHTGASAGSSADAVTGVAANGTTTAVTGVSTSKLVTTTVAPNSHTHSYGSSTALTSEANSGTAVAAVTSVAASTN